MLKEIRPKSYQKYVNLPVLGPIMEIFTLWSHHHGYTPGTIGLLLTNVRHVDRYLLSHGVQCLNDLTHGIFEIAWQDFNHRCPKKASTVHLIERFLEETRGLSPLILPPKTQTTIELDHFSDYLQKARRKLAGQTTGGKPVSQTKTGVGEG